MDFIENLACMAAILLSISAKRLVRSVFLFYSFAFVASALTSFFLLDNLLPGPILKSFFALVSLAIWCRMGPPTDRRLLMLAEWMLQMVAMATIYSFLPDHQVSIAIIAVLIFSKFWRDCTARSLREMLFGPQPRRLLSEQEYLAESQIYTCEELDKLRQFCQSQEPRRKWQQISRLRTPNRMASFLAGNSEHVSATETTRHYHMYDDDSGGRGRGSNHQIGRNDAQMKTARLTTDNTETEFQRPPFQLLGSTNNNKIAAIPDICKPANFAPPHHQSQLFTISRSFDLTTPFGTTTRLDLLNILRQQQNNHNSRGRHPNGSIVTAATGQQFVVGTTPQRGTRAGTEELVSSKIAHLSLEDG